MNYFEKWCADSHLKLSVSKTKDMIIDFSKSGQRHSPTVIIGQFVEEVTQYKYLATIMGFGLNFKANCEAVCPRGHQRL